MIVSGTAIVTVLFLHVNSVSVESSLPLLATRAVWEREAGGGRREGDGATRRKLYLASPMKDWQPCMAGVGGIESRGRGLTVLELGRNGEDEGNCRVERGEKVKSSFVVGGSGVEILVRGRQGRNEGGLLLEQADNHD